MFIKEQEGPGPTAAKDATPRAGSQRGPPLPREAIAILTVTATASCGFGEVLGGDVSAPSRCLYCTRLSQSLRFSLKGVTLLYLRVGQAERVTTPRVVVGDRWVPNTL